MIIENVEENRKKTISYSFKPPIWLQFRIGADIDQYCLAKSGIM